MAQEWESAAPGEAAGVAGVERRCTGCERIAPRPRAVAGRRPPLAQSQHPSRQPSQHRRARRPRQRLLCPLAGSRHDLSAAAFDRGGSLVEAQQRKYQRMLELIDAAPGAHILEIGCGWGGFAEHAARRATATGITLSAEQLAFACERIARARGSRVTLRPVRLP